MSAHPHSPCSLRACPAQCAEFYGREFSLFDGIAAKGSSLPSLAQLLEGCDNAKRRSVLLHMTKALMPIVEKGILHPPMVHRCVCARVCVRVRMCVCARTYVCVRACVCARTCAYVHSVRDHMAPSSNMCVSAGYSAAGVVKRMLDGSRCVATACSADTCVCPQAAQRLLRLRAVRLS